MYVVVTKCALFVCYTSCMSGEIFNPFQSNQLRPLRADQPTHSRLGGVGERLYRDLRSKTGVIRVSKEAVIEPLGEFANLLTALTPEEEQLYVERTAVEILGRENVHGVEDVETLFGKGFIDPSKVPPIPYSIKDLHLSRKMERERGIQEMLVLFVTDKDGTPLTGERMKSLIQHKYTELDLGKFLYDQNWYNDEAFFKELGLTYCWKLITKQCIPESKDKTFDQQTKVIDEYADNLGIDRALITRPEPFQMLYAVALHLVATEAMKGKGRGERLLDDEYHRSEVASLNRHPVYVGGADATGAYVTVHSAGNTDCDLGVCCSREPSLKGSLEIKL